MSFVITTNSEKSNFNFLKKVQLPVTVRNVNQQNTLD